MAKTGKNHLRRWEYPAGSGIRVAEIINRHAGQDGGISYRVTIPSRLAGERQFKQFRDLEVGTCGISHIHSPRLACLSPVDEPVDESEGS